MMLILNSLLNLPRERKRVIQVAADGVIIAVCYALAMFLRLDSWEFARSAETWYVLVPVIPITIFVFARLGLYRAVLRYIELQAIKAVFLGVGCSAIAIYVTSQSLGWFVPRSVPAIYGLLAVILLGGIRMIWRTLYRRVVGQARVHVLVYGAGASGRQVVASLQRSAEYAPTAFLDDDKSLHRSLISGLTVNGLDKLPELVARHGAKTVLLAMPRLTRAERKAIIERLEPFGLEIRTIPSMSALVTGSASLSDIVAVSAEDLLWRDSVPPQPHLMSANIAGKSVLITGAGGSIGSELCRQIISQKPRALVLLEQSEFNLYLIEQELSEIVGKSGLDTDLHAVLGSVQHPKRIQSLLRHHGIETVYHAAAYKHVPLVEANSIEGVQNNVFGTLTLAKAAVAEGVASFILISTDKAVRPTNIMGATKRMAELVCQALAAQQTSTTFAMVRFGNVLESSGSVIPKFRKQIEKGGPVTVTAPEVTRYFMTIPEAAQLVIQAGAMSNGGDVFVLDMGEPVKILDLAKRMIRLSGLSPWERGEGAGDEGDIEIVFTGLRPGEKLYEELLISETAIETQHPHVMSEEVLSLEWDTLTAILNSLESAAKSNDAQAVQAILAAAPIAYVPAPN